jgi:hypothetical protein
LVRVFEFTKSLKHAGYENSLKYMRAKSYSNKTQFEELSENKGSTVFVSDSQLRLLDLRLSSARVHDSKDSTLLSDHFLPSYIVLFGNEVLRRHFSIILFLVVIEHVCRSGRSNFNSTMRTDEEMSGDCT